MKLTGKVAVVAGSGRGTGRAIALELAKEGADVVTNARHKENAESVAQEIRKLGRRSWAIGADLSKPPEAREMIEQAARELGKIDIFVYNAALERPGPLLELTVEEWDSMLDTNLKGYFVCSQAVAKEMIKHKVKGKIIAISSIAGLVGFPLLADYCAAKGGMIALTKEMAIELAPYGITANSIAPAVIQSQIVDEGGQRPGVAEAWRYMHPLKRFAKPEEIGRLTVFLASSDSDYLTGCIIPFDGGLLTGATAVPTEYLGSGQLAEDYTAGLQMMRPLSQT